MTCSRGDYNKSWILYDEALELNRVIDDQLSEGDCLIGQGTIALLKNDLDAAEVCHKTALTLYTKSGHNSGEGACTLRLGDIARLRGNYDDARSLYDNALRLYKKSGNTLEKPLASRVWATSRVSRPTTAGR